MNNAIASNNTKDIIQIVKEYDLEWIKVGDLLERAFKEDMITKEYAEVIWKKMLNK